MVRMLIITPNKLVHARPSTPEPVDALEVERERREQRNERQDVHVVLDGRVAACHGDEPALEADPIGEERRPHIAMTASGGDRVERHEDRVGPVSPCVDPPRGGRVPVDHGPHPARGAVRAKTVRRGGGCARVDAHGCDALERGRQRRGGRSTGCRLSVHDGFEGAPHGREPRPDVHRLALPRARCRSLPRPEEDGARARMLADVLVGETAEELHPAWRVPFEAGTVGPVADGTAVSPRRVHTHRWRARGV